MMRVFYTERRFSLFTNTFVKNVVTVVKFLVVGFLAATLNACSQNDDNAISASYKIDTSPSQFSISVLNSLKSAISRNSNQDAYQQLNDYLRKYQFTDLNNNISLPQEITTTHCSGPELNLRGDLIRTGDIQAGELIFSDFCVELLDNNKNKRLLVVHGSANYSVDMPVEVKESSLNIYYDITASLDMEKHIYFGMANIKLFAFADDPLVTDAPSVTDAPLVVQYTDAQGNMYDTDALNVKGDVNLGYHIRGNIGIGEQGNIHVQTSRVLRYGQKCIGRPISGKIDITTKQIGVSIEVLESLCQIQICSSKSGNLLKDCETI